VVFLPSCKNSPNKGLIFSEEYCDQFFDFTSDNITINGQINNEKIEVFLRDKNTGIMARVSGDNVSELKLEIK
jgi:hypothetical protein